jgi:transposase
LRDRRCKQDEAQIARALEGTWRVEHLFELRQALEQYDFTCGQISQADGEIEKQLQQLQLDDAGAAPSPRIGKSKKRRKKGNPLDDAVGSETRRKSLFGCAGVDLTQIEGIAEGTALVLLSEIGPDLSRFATSKQFCSWLGLCPQVKKSGGKVLSSGVRPGPNRAAQALRLAANTLRTSQSGLGAFFRRILSRGGKAKAVTATAHRLARLVYALLTRGGEYVSQSQEDYERAFQERQLRQLQKKARQLGYELTAVADKADKADKAAE